MKIKIYCILLMTLNLLGASANNDYPINKIPKLHSIATQSKTISPFEFQGTQNNPTHASLNPPPLSIQSWQIKYAKAQSIVELITNNGHPFLTNKGNINFDSRTNTIWVRDTKETLSQIQNIITQLDIPVKQVQIEARIVNIDHDFQKELGIHFKTHSSHSHNDPFSSPQVDLPSIQLEAGHYQLSIGNIASGTLLDLELAALEKQGQGKILSRPSLITANQTSASIEAGEEIPYQEVSKSGATSVAFKKAVLSLKVTPTILPNHMILLELDVKQDRPSAREVLGVPAIHTRHLSTNVLTHSGKTIVLGGIYEENTGSGELRVPGLWKVPILGHLFKQRTVTRNKRELLIFVTPTIIDDQDNNDP